MRVLFVASKAWDHLAACVWDGLQEVLGEAAVVDALAYPWLHSVQAIPQSLGFEGLSRSRRGWTHIDGRGYDLLVVNASFDRDHDWAWLRDAMLPLLRPGGRVAYLEGWDAAWQIHEPLLNLPTSRLAVFRKEISRGVRYPYDPHHLTFAAPARWFVESGEERVYDVVFIGSPSTCDPSYPDLRWSMLREMFRTRKKHRSVAATHGIGLDTYERLLRSSRLALCPVAADSADSLRTYEAIACGAIPVFVGYPEYVRDPWFSGEHCVSCSVGTLAEHLDEVLTHNLAEMRAKLRAHALEHHTTRARALKLLRVCGFTEGRDW